MKMLSYRKKGKIETANINRIFIFDSNEFNFKNIKNVQQKCFVEVWNIEYEDKKQNAITFDNKIIAKFPVILKTARNMTDKFWFFQDFFFPMNERTGKIELKNFKGGFLFQNKVSRISARTGYDFYITDAETFHKAIKNIKINKTQISGLIPIFELIHNKIFIKRG